MELYKTRLPELGSMPWMDIAILQEDNAVVVTLSAVYTIWCRLYTTCHSK